MSLHPAAGSRLTCCLGKAGRLFEYNLTKGELTLILHSQQVCRKNPSACTAFEHRLLKPVIDATSRLD